MHSNKVDEIILESLKAGKQAIKDDLEKLQKDLQKHRLSCLGCPKCVIMHTEINGTKNVIAFLESTEKEVGQSRYTKLYELLGSL